MSTYRMPTIKSFMRYVVLRRAAPCCVVPACHSYSTVFYPASFCRPLLHRAMPCHSLWCDTLWSCILGCCGVVPHCSFKRAQLTALFRRIARRRTVPCRLADSPVGGEGQKSTDHAPTATREHPKTAATAAHPAHALARLLPQRRGRRAPGSQ